MPRVPCPVRRRPSRAWSLARIASRLVSLPHAFSILLPWPLPRESDAARRCCRWCEARLFIVFESIEWLSAGFGIFVWSRLFSEGHRRQRQAADDDTHAQLFVQRRCTRLPARRRPLSKIYICICVCVRGLSPSFSPRHWPACVVASGGLVPHPFAGASTRSYIVTRAPLLPRKARARWRGRFTYTFSCSCVCLPWPCDAVGCVAPSPPPYTHTIPRRLLVIPFLLILPVPVGSDTCILELHCVLPSGVPVLHMGASTVECAAQR